MLTGARLSHLLIYVHNIDMSTEFYHRQLGIPLIEQTNSWAKLDAGQIVIHLRRAVDHGVTLYGRRDDSSDIVFLVEDLERMREALAGRGIHFERRRSYEVGLVTDFYDPNGHRLMLYQPSETAMTWPSADKIREVWRACGRGGADVIGPSAGPALGTDAETGLAGNPLIYLFMFENNQTRAYEFYRDALRLTSLERVHCCNQDCDAEIEGIVKYDGGGVLLSTHHMHEKSMVYDDLGQPYSPKKFTPAHGQGIAPVFLVDDVEGMMAALSARGVRFERGLEQDVDGEYARFEDPFGHPFFIHRPRTRVGAAA